MKPVHVVGYGMSDALGTNPNECYEKMLDPIDYSREIPGMKKQCEEIFHLAIHRGAMHDEDRIVMPEGFDKKMWRSMTNAQKMMSNTTEQAMRMAGLERKPNVATLASTVSNDTEGIDVYFEYIKYMKRGNARRAVNRIPDMGCMHITSYYGFKGLSTATFASCATGMVNIDYAMRLVDEYDYVICTAGDCANFPMGIKYFACLGALSNYSMPFDDRRAGFLMGDGGACMILQSEEKRKEFNSKSYAKLYQCGMASDAVDMVNPEGTGTRTSMIDALHHYGTGAVDYVCTHGTSTVAGDPVEYEAVSEVLPGTKMWAPKSKIGHTLAASGILEGCYAIESMRNGVVPHIQNLKECSLDVHGTLVRENEHFTMHNRKRSMLNNSFGFGGKCMSQVIEVELEQHERANPE